MLDFGHITNSPDVDVQIFTGQSNTTLLQWQTWVKPRGAKMVYMIGVGGGSSGGLGANAATTSGGGAGGSSGAQTSLMIPATFLPDRLYIQAGAGGKQPATLVSAAVGVVGLPTYVTIEPTVTAIAAATTLLFANAGPVTGAAATATTGGVAGSAAAVTTIAAMPLAGRGIYTFFAGQAGAAGGANTAAGATITPPTTGLMVMGGSGGGGTNAGTQFAGGAIVQPTNTQGTFFPPIPGGIASVGATPAGAGAGGIILPNNIMNYGGVGGGGASSTTGGIAGDGGNGAPGCGGGGAGAPNSVVTTLARPGNGGDGFVIIYSW